MGLPCLLLARLRERESPLGVRLPSRLVRARVRVRVRVRIRVRVRVRVMIRIRVMIRVKVRTRARARVSGVWLGLARLVGQRLARLAQPLGV